jgi:diaminohydroxyphosphoribosylaminopyrimidine deaminase/5-amino-6-(5-phosphoribosylamino)uracil reductase
MLRALSLAERGRLSTAPNPWVGCVFVAADNATVVAEGYHVQKGAPHAEAAALLDADRRGVRDLLAACTCYVTLEPCHRGPGKTTPPCDEALAACGVRSVHVALLDPDPTFGNAGVSFLRASGIEVTVGTAAAAVSASLRPYLHQRLTGSPWVVLKVATSTDGAIACADGTSQWITGPAARAHSQLLRASSQAILVGSGTALTDEPRLTVRLEPGTLPPDWLPPARPPLRVVVDASGRLDRGPLLDTRLAPTLVCTTSAAPPGRVALWRERGADVAVLPAAGGGGGGVDLDALLVELGRRGVIQLMVEGGGMLIGSYLAARRANELQLYVGACALGATSARWIKAPLADTIGQARRFRLLSTEVLGDDVCIRYAMREEEG